MSQANVVLCAPVRTAIGTYGGSLKDVAAPTLGSGHQGDAVPCQDRWALRTQPRFAAAQATGKFDPEIPTLDFREADLGRCPAACAAWSQVETTLQETREEIARHGETSDQKANIECETEKRRDVTSIENRMPRIIFDGPSNGRPSRNQTPPPNGRAD